MHGSLPEKGCGAAGSFQSKMPWLEPIHSRKRRLVRDDTQRARGAHGARSRHQGKAPPFALGRQRLAGRKAPPEARFARPGAPESRGRQLHVASLRCSLPLNGSATNLTFSPQVPQDQRVGVACRVLACTLPHACCLWLYRWNRCAIRGGGPSIWRLVDLAPLYRSAIEGALIRIPFQISQ